MSDSSGSSVATQLFEDSFEGWRVRDEPYVVGDNFAEDEGVDEMLDELGRRLHKSGRITRYEQTRRYTKPSEQRRKEEQAQAHRAKIGEEARWRGGVEP
jgi:ribosomal protein S21